MTEAYTATPYKVGEARHTAELSGVYDTSNKNGGSPRLVAYCQRIADAAFIVRACNSHGALLAALETAEKVIAALSPGMAHVFNLDYKLVNDGSLQVRAALKAARDSTSFVVVQAPPANTVCLPAYLRTFTKMGKGNRNWSPHASDAHTFQTRKSAERVAAAVRGNYISMNGWTIEVRSVQPV